MAKLVDGYPPFFMWYKITCNNKRRGYGKAVCGNTLLIIDGKQANVKMMLRCSACRAQVILSFNKSGACDAYIPSKKYYVETISYPVISQGEYKKRKLNDSNREI